jgi:hypothetical protein
MQVTGVLHFYEDEAHFDKTETDPYVACLRYAHS